MGIGVRGRLDLERGLTVFLPNLPGTLPNVPLRDLIAEKMGLLTALISDARAMTLGEWYFGAGRAMDTVACYAIGTGIGAELIINGHLALGLKDMAGEMRDQVIDFNRPMCGCGNRGCIGAYASGPAIAAMGGEGGDTRVKHLHW